MPPFLGQIERGHQRVAPNLGTGSSFCRPRPWKPPQPFLLENPTPNHRTALPRAEELARTAWGPACCGGVIPIGQVVAIQERELGAMGMQEAESPQRDRDDTHWATVESLWNVTARASRGGVTGLSLPSPPYDLCLSPLHAHHNNISVRCR
jgi:hypothetical protein